MLKGTIDTVELQILTHTLCQGTTANAHQRVLSQYLHAERPHLKTGTNRTVAIPVGDIAGYVGETFNHFLNEGGFQLLMLVYPLLTGLRYFRFTSGRVLLFSSGAFLMYCMIAAPLTRQFSLLYYMLFVSLVLVLLHSELMAEKKP